MRPAPAPVRILGASAALALAMLLGATLPFSGALRFAGKADFTLGVLLGGALGGLFAGALLAGRRWALRLGLPGPRC